MLNRVTEVFTAPILIAQFSVLAISLLWSFFVIDAQTMALLEALSEFEPLAAK